MSVEVEKLENNRARLTIEVPAEDLERALQSVYDEQKSRISIPGFRKGKVPRQMVERMYGPGIFYEDAANDLINETYPDAVTESGVDAVTRPELEVVQIEKGKPFIYTAQVILKPEVTLGKYKGIEVEKVDVTVSEADVDKEIEQERERNARNVTVEDRPIAEGDIAVIDFEGFVDGMPFEGGKAENHSLAIGSHTFIDGFEEQLVGKNVGDETEVDVTFPEDYHAEELAGKSAVFKVKVNEIKAKELPELDDEFAQDVSEFDTLAEYREDILAQLKERKEAAAKHTREDEALLKIVEGSTMDIPEEMIDTQVDNMINDLVNQLISRGLTFEQYMRVTGMDIDQLREHMRPDADKQIRATLVLDQISKEEDIQVSEEEVEKEYERLSELYAMSVEELKERLSDSAKDNIKHELVTLKTVDFVMDNVKE